MVPAKRNFAKINLKSDSLLLNFIRAGFGRGVSQLINFIALPLITRLYKPSEYALWALFLAAGMILGSIANLRLELAIVLPKQDEEASAIFWGAMIVSLGVALLGSTGLALFSKMAAFIPLYVVGFVGLFVFLFAVYQGSIYWNVRLQRFAYNSWAQIIFVSVTFLVQITWALFYKATAMGLILGSMLGQASALAFLLVSASMNNVFPCFCDNLFREASIQLKRYKNFIFYSTPYTLLGALRDRGALFIMSYFAGNVVVGYYALTYRVLSFPANLIASSVRQVLFREATKSGVQAVETYIFNIIRILVVVSMPFLVLYLLFAEEIYRVVFGASWAEAGYIGKYIIIAPYTLLFTTWLDRLMDVLGKQRLALILEIAFSLIAVAGLIVGFVLNTGVGGALAMYATILACYNVIYLPLVYRIAGLRGRRWTKVIIYGAISGMVTLFIVLLGKLFLM